MRKEEDPDNNYAQRSWMWSDCKLVLRRTNINNPTEESYQNLEAQVELQSEDVEEPFIPEVRFSKQLLFNARKGFYWKKSRPLPPLIVKLQKSYLDLLKQDEEIIMIYCELTVAYPKRKDTHFYLQQIFTVGQKRKLITDHGEVVFDGILIKESSVQNLNSKFSVIVSVCASSIEQSKIILKTLISTAFDTQNNKLVRRRKHVRQFSTIKLHSPTQFMKPLEHPIVEYKQPNFKEKILEFLKYMNQKSNILRRYHPFYVIYQFYHIINVYYHSEQISSLHEILNMNCSNSQGEKEGFQSVKNQLLNFQLKKTKKIKKFNVDLKKQNKTTTKQIIRAQFHPTKTPHRKLLLITFQHKILQFIINEIQKQTTQQSSYFQQQLEKQILQLAKIFQKWSFFYFKVDLLRKQSLQTFWKDIERDSVFETYKEHYHVIHQKLKKQEDETNNEKPTQSN